ncbi:septum formation inhibitor Maf [Fusobacterium perfoetens]|uniref:Maf family protein n=1 Tax=Fusobacterium perfoetens TaxID=852 RepID=UPI0015A19C7C|nr:Maf family protein [Fusobacterium perfoetens]MCF2624667.1 septum formation inhibitor Maf [Fusobacterium perfoetens]
MILASASPRRKEILENFGFSFKTIVKNIDEISNKNTAVEKIKDIAEKKAKAVAEDFPNEYVVGADTAVVVDGKILGKPHNRLEAFNMLKSLSGKSHEVITAFSFVNLTEKILYSDCEVTKVYFKTLTDDEINWYIDTKEPMDKAGAYGIQGKGAFFVEKIEGDFFSVMGFPLGKFIRFLSSAGFDLNNLEKI